MKSAPNWTALRFAAKRKINKNDLKKKSLPFDGIYVWSFTSSTILDFYPERF